MIDAIKNLGFVYLNEFLQQRGIKGRIFSVEEFGVFRKRHPNLVAQMLAQKIDPPRKGKIRVWVFSNEGSKEPKDWKFYLTDYDQENWQKYLYRKGGARKEWLSPSFLRADKINECLRKFKKFDRPVTPFETIYALFKQFASEFRRVWNEKNQDKILFTFKIDGNYLSGLPQVAKEFVDSFCKEFRAPKKGRKAMGRGYCTACGRGSLEVFGSVQPYNFYSVDKEGFFSGMLVENAWKNFPVCEDCALLLEFGKVFIDSCFDSTVGGKNIRIGGHRVKVIPKVLMLEDRLQQLFDIRVFDQFRRIGEKKFPDEVEKIPDRESFLLTKLNEFGVVGSYEFVFYEQRQDAFVILRHISDILPSRIKHIGETIKILNQKILNDEFFKYDNVFGFSFSFLYRLFTPISDRTKESYILDSLYLADCIFTGRPVLYQVLVKDFTTRLQAIYLNSLDQPKLTRSNLEREVSIMVWLFEFLQRLEVIRMEKVPQNPVEVETGIETLKRFLDERKAFFDKPEKLVCFLLGVLFGKIESIQFADRKAAPIQKHLKSLNLIQRDIERLFSEVRKKFMEYGAFSTEAQEVAAILSSQWTKCSKWQLTRDEIPFYFCLGWVLYKKFLPAKENLNRERRKI